MCIRDRRFRERDDAERRAVRDTFMRLPDEQSRQVVLERGHEPAVVISDDQEDQAPPDPSDRSAT
eukprot:7173265-Alexandrium_andersonii.AAC.1